MAVLPNIINKLIGFKVKNIDAGRQNINEICGSNKQEKDKFVRHSFIDTNQNDLEQKWWTLQRQVDHEDFFELLFTVIDMFILNVQILVIFAKVSE